MQMFINQMQTVFNEMQMQVVILIKCFLKKCKLKCFDSTANVLDSKNANAAFSNTNAFEPKPGLCVRACMRACLQNVVYLSLMTRKSGNISILNIPPKFSEETVLKNKFRNRNSL